MSTIWILNHYAITPDTSGGTRHYDFGRELVRRGFRVVIFASSFPHTGEKKETRLVRGEYYKIEWYEGIEFVWVRTFPYQANDWRRILNMVSYSWRVLFLGEVFLRKGAQTAKPDVIIGSSPHLIAGVSAYLLSLWYKASFVMEIRDVWPQVFVDIGIMKKGSVSVRILGLMERFLYKRAQKIIFFTPEVKDYLVSLGIDEKKAVLISNGVDLSRFSGVQVVNRSDQEFRVVFTGSVVESNGLKYLIKAAELIRKRGYRDIRIFIYGNGAEKENLVKLVDSLALDFVSFPPSVSKDDIPRVLLSADVLMDIDLNFAYSNFGGSPNKVYDYLAAGKPIVYASDFVKKMLDKIGCGVYAVPGDPEAIADAIIKVYKMSAEERSRLGARGRVFVEKNYSIPVLADKLEHVVREVVVRSK